MSFKKLSELQLAEYLLSKGISIDATEKLKNEEIDRTAFLELNALLLHAMGIKMGQAIKIQAIIEGKKKNDSVLKDVTCFKDTTAIAFSLTETLNSPLDESAVSPTLSSTLQLSPDVLNESRKIKLNVSTTDVQVALRLDNIDFNIRSLLDEHQTGKLVLAEYDSTGALIKRLQDMIHIVVNSMVHRVGIMYPSTKTKSNLAKAIITAFPKLHSSGKLGYENYYSPYTEFVMGNKKKKVTPHGHIEERLKTMRKHVGVQVQARRKRVIVLAEEFHSSAPFSKEEISMIAELRFDDLGYEKKLDYMEKTSCSRRKWIVNCRPTFDDLLKTFPPLKDLSKHFQKDFCCNFAELNDFLAQWELITPHVISWARQKTNLMVKQILAELDMQDNPSIGIEMDFALLLLPFIIKVPSKNKSCASAAEVAEHFIQFYPASTPMEIML
ncbi:uncharacterized protein LOC124818403 isoform X2 [Hydra vulgaris]|uniref:uncharacterized protein LOC124818403 isoform X2 n=1 Tax=Hydra vulgaris TaxID=6087 RepID=UPI001F5E491F|nr:uncharacterized protein LOC124818403 isoform X3 [Hydra vulgaris]